MKPPTHRASTALLFPRALRGASPTPPPPRLTYHYRGAHSSSRSASLRTNLRLAAPATTTPNLPCRTPPQAISARDGSSMATPASTPQSGPSTSAAASRAGPCGAAQPRHDPRSVPDDDSGGDNDRGAGAAAAAATLPALPVPGEGEPTQTLEVGGKAVALDHLGPMVVGRDGTISRIANWGEMTDVERQNTLRILGRRNQLRLASLRREGEGKAE